MNIGTNALNQFCWGNVNTNLRFEFYSFHARLYLISISSIWMKTEMFIAFYLPCFCLFYSNLHPFASMATFSLSVRGSASELGLFRLSNAALLSNKVMQPPGHSDIFAPIPARNSSGGIRACLLWCVFLC